MDGFVLDRELGDWDLQAIVKGCKNHGANIIAVKNKTEETHGRRGDEALEHLQVVDSCTNQRICDHATEKGNSAKDIYKSRRRKNNHGIKVVQQEADSVLSDKWNWRKYGQKTIKGSPYPRNYYKCSSASSGGCKARKQVEHNNTNPETLLIAYFHEHNHPYPTRRHSQAGRTKERFHPSPKLDFTMSELSSSNMPRSESSSFGGDGCGLDNLERDIINDGCLEDIGGRNMVWDDEFLGGFEGLPMDLLWDAFSFDSLSSN